MQLSGLALGVPGLTTDPTTVGTPIIENANGFAGTLNVTIATGTNTFGGVLRNGTGTGPLYLTKLGGGNLVLTGASSYTGDTVIGGGTLTIDHGGSNSGQALRATAVSVQTGATLRVNGSTTIAGSIAVAGGFTSPSPGTLSLLDGATSTLTLGGNLSVGERQWRRDSQFRYRLDQRCERQDQRRRHGDHQRHDHDQLDDSRPRRG